MPIEVNMTWALHNVLKKWDYNHAIEVSMQVHQQDSIRDLSKEEERLWEKLTERIEYHKINKLY